MDWSDLFNFLGAGGGLVVLLRWLTELPFAKLRLKGKREEAFRDMLDKDSELIGKLHGDILLLQKQVNALERCLERLVLCPSYSRCPARHVVQDYKSKFYHARMGQPQLGQKGKRKPRDNPTQPGGDQLPAANLLELPPGAEYTNRSGQATVSLSMEGDTLVATARCDSLQRLVLELSEQIHRREQQEAREEEQKTAPAITFWQRFKWCSTGVLIGFILTVIIQFIYKIWQKTRKRHP